MKTTLTSHLLIIIMFLPLFGKTQLITISGNVLHSKNGKALENVNIFESVSNIGTITNENGFYKLILNQGELEIRISKDGFNDYSQKLILKSDTTLLVELMPEINSKRNQKKPEQIQAVLKSEKKSNDQRRFKFKQE
jgi:hypothetical protein